MRIDSGQFVVVCMVKNGEYFMKEFIRHYTQLGAQHIVFVDNGSTDQTVPIAMQASNVSVLQCLLPAKRYETDMRRYAAQVFCRGGWCLFADIDEFMDYPGRDTATMKDILDYLNINEYSAVVGQLVDMYPMSKISESDGLPGSGDFLRSHCYYETEGIELIGYHADNNPYTYFLHSNRVSETKISCAFGGVRGRVFGTNNGLTKHPLVKVVQGVTPSTHPHCSSGVYCADFTVLLKHYKFAGDFAERIKKQVAASAWDHGEDEIYLQRVKEESPVLYYPGKSKSYISAEKAMDGHFLLASNRYLEWVGKGRSNDINCKSKHYGQSGVL